MNKIFKTLKYNNLFLTKYFCFVFQIFNFYRCLLRRYYEVPKYINIFEIKIYKNSNTKFLFITKYYKFVAVSNISIIFYLNF